MRQPGHPRHRWDADSIRALRLFLDVSQSVFANYLGVRQQTVSEWETGVYRPRGASSTLLSLIAEQASFRYSGPPAERQPIPAFSGQTPTPQPRSSTSAAPPGRPPASPAPPGRVTRVVGDRDAGSRGYIPYVPPALRPSPRPQNFSGPTSRNEIAF
ncbi:MAG: helix-turn-helix domain-containing protein [Dehalococcoidia bacterium]|nr:helix-turn-helix domain-containing protein [Dehalococcoidia bacterium]